MDAEIAAIPWEQAYHLMTAAVIPRPIAWVSTTSPQGVHNIAPFSFFNGFSARPLVLGFAPMHTADRDRKDTLANVVATKAFVINIVTEPLLEAMDATSAAFPPDVDEFVQTGLTPEPARAVAAPRIKEARVHFECELYRLVELGDGGPGSSVLVLGRCVHLHVADEIMRDGRIDPALLRPVARLGGALYARPELLEFTRHDRR